MKVKLTQEQININVEIGQLRNLKEGKKIKILDLNNDITHIDMRIRELRQKWGDITLVEKESMQIQKKKVVETNQEKISRLRKELEELEKMECKT